MQTRIAVKKNGLFEGTGFPGVNPEVKRWVIIT